VLCAGARFLDESPDGVVYAAMCFLVRFVEALGAAAFLTTSFAIIANTFPDRVATMFVRTVDVCTGMGTAGIPRNPRISRGCGYRCCGNTAGMDLTIAGFPLGSILLRRELRIEPFA